MASNNMNSIAKNSHGQVQQSSTSSLLTIKHDTMQAKISLYGGQVLSWKPLGERDVFWLSENAFNEKGKAIRGGVPICWPWFGKHPNDENNKAGNHGFARCQLWKIDSIDISEQGVEIILSWHGKNMSDLWPADCSLKQVLFFGKTFTQVLTMTNLSEKDVYYTGALHSYLLVSAPANTTLTQLTKAPFEDSLTGNFCLAEELPTSLANGIDEIDRIYHSDDVIDVVDNVWQRTITLSTTDTKQWVFWNPGEELAKQMVDIHDGGEQEFICLEAANTQRQLLKAGKSLAMAQSITVKKHVNQRE